MNKDYYDITSLDDLRSVRRDVEVKISESKCNIKECWSVIVESASPGKMVASTLGGMVSAVSEISLLRRGYAMLMTFIDKIVPPDRDEPSEEQPVVENRQVER